MFFGFIIGVLPIGVYTYFLFCIDIFVLITQYKVGKKFEDASYRVSAADQIQSWKNAIQQYHTEHCEFLRRHFIIIGRMSRFCLFCFLILALSISMTRSSDDEQHQESSVEPAHKSSAAPRSASHGPKLFVQRFFRGTPVSFVAALVTLLALVKLVALVSLVALASFVAFVTLLVLFATFAEANVMIQPAQSTRNFRD
uniref:Uncharacterized protein n=1 Tax=Romanomermis culicivorax TaxID=13658 RepID=A0A915HNN6_ROMCU